MINETHATWQHKNAGYESWYSQETDCEYCIAPLNGVFVMVQLAWSMGESTAEKPKVLCRRTCGSLAEAVREAEELDFWTAVAIGKRPEVMMESRVPGVDAIQGAQGRGPEPGVHRPC